MLIADSPTRYHEVDWQVTSAERRPDGPGDKGEDVDTSEDFIYAELEISNPLDDITFSVPFEWLTISTSDGTSFRPDSAIDPGTGRSAFSLVEVEPNRTERLTVAFAIDANDSFDGGWFNVDAGNLAPAAMAGPQSIDETQRIQTSVSPGIYEGPYSRDLAEVVILGAFWSRELGIGEEGQLIDDLVTFDRRPEPGHALLLVQVEVTCIFGDGINTGGCNTGSGEATVDGQGVDGNTYFGGVDYDVTEIFWTAFQVPVDATEMSFTLGGDSNFVVDDLSGLQVFAQE